jgi:DNA-binding transcriptional LysR family regulator
MKYLNVDWLYSFKKLAETGNFNIASNDLNITIQTLSYHIRCLENYFNIILIERGKKNNLLTFEGQIFLNKTLPFLESLENTKSIVKANNNESDLFLKLIQSTDCNFDYCLSETIYNTHIKYPNVKIVNESILFFDLEKNLSIYNTDIAISSYPINNKNFISMKIAQIPYVIASKRLEKNWEKLDYIKSDYHLMRTNHKFDSICTKYTLNSSMSVSTLSVAVSMAKRGLGSLYLPVLDIEKEIIENELEFILSPDDDYFEIYLVVNKLKSEEILILDFISFFDKSIKKSLSTLIS